MALHNETNKDLAKALSISETSFSGKINNNKREFTQSEMATIIERYSLTPNQINEIFFNSKVS